MTHTSNHLNFARLALIVLIGLGFSTVMPTAFANDYGGTWTKRYQTIKGSWSIVKTDDGSFLELGDDFKTKSAPDLKLFLSKLPASEVTPENAVSSSVLLAPLKSAKGEQRYALPADLDLDKYKTLALHCEEYTKLWGVSPLQN